MGVSVVRLAAVKVMMVIVGETEDRSKAKVIRIGPFSKAVIEGMWTPPGGGLSLVVVNDDERPFPPTTSPMPFESKRPPKEEEEESPPPPIPPSDVGIMAPDDGETREWEEEEVGSIFPFIRAGPEFNRSVPPTPTPPPPPPPPISPPNMSNRLSK